MCSCWRMVHHLRQNKITAKQKKKFKKLIKLKKLKKNNWKYRTVKKNRLNWLEFLKNRPVRFHKPETEKTEPNPNWKNRAKPKKSSQTGKNQTVPNRNRSVWTGFCSKKTEPNRTRSVWTGFGFFKKTGLIIFW